MILTSEDIQAVAAEVVRQLRAAEDRRTDNAYLVKLPADEFKKIQQEKMRQYKAAMKEAKK